MLVQPSRKVPVAMTRGCQFAKAYWGRCSQKDYGTQDEQS
jgi:hypothetical protein